MDFSQETLNTFRILCTTLYGLFAGSVSSSLLFSAADSASSHQKMGKNSQGPIARIFHFAFGGAILPMVVLVYGALATANTLYKTYQKISENKSKKTGQQPL